MATTRYEELRAILDKCEATGAGTVYEGYSGRGMFGERCLGFDCDDPNVVQARVSRAGFPAGRVDSLGLGYIVYWPGVKA